MFGAYQVGAWSIIRQEFQPDIVLGASAGSLNAWCFASLCSDHDLSRHWLDMASMACLRWRLPTSRWSGFADPSGLEQSVHLIYREFLPRIRTGIVLTDAWRMRGLVVWTPQVTAEHLLASCAIPLVFPARMIDGVRCIDGGVLAPLPMWAALECGATEIVTIHSMPTLPGVLRAPVQLLRRIRGFSDRVPGPAVRIRTIQPESPLGAIRDALVWNRDSIVRWMDQGRRDAQKVLGSKR